MNCSYCSDIEDLITCWDCDRFVCKDCIVVIAQFIDRVYCTECMQTFIEEVEHKRLRDEEEETPTKKRKNSSLM